MGEPAVRKPGIDEIGTGDVFVSLMDLVTTENGTFRGPPSPDIGARTFGGQYLAQSIMAACRTVDPDRTVHSLHAYFLRQGDASKAIDYAVDPVRDGRSFSLRQVIACQDGKELFRTMISLHVVEPGLDYEIAGDHDVPPPDDVVETYTTFSERMIGSDEPWPGANRPMDIHYINPPEGRTGPPVTEPQLMWMRISEDLPDDPQLHAAGLAYLADSTLVDHVALPHGLRWQDERLTGASLDHAMWFHRPAAADGWLLYDQRIEATGSQRGLATGRFFTPAGHLVATCGQEGLMRVAL